MDASTLGLTPFRGSAAVAAGLSTPARLRGVRFRRLFRDVYVGAAVPVDHLTLCTAAALPLPPGAALSHRSAAMLHNTNVLAVGQPVEVTAAAGIRSQPGLRVARSPLAEVDRWHRGGLPVTRPLRTAFDLARGPDLVAAVVGVDAMLYRRVVRPDTVRAYLGRHAGWNGVAAARRVLGLARLHVESPMETRLRLGVVLAGLPEPVVQYEVKDAGATSSPASTSPTPAAGSAWTTTATTTATATRSVATPSGSTACACSAGAFCASPPTTCSATPTGCSPRSAPPWRQPTRWRLSAVCGATKQR